MDKKLSELRAAMRPAAQQKADSLAQTMLAEMPLHALRQARGLSQEMLTEVLNVQPAIAKMEKRTDMYLSTLRSHVEAMGSALDNIAQFPDGAAVKISNFTELGPSV